MNKRDRLIIAAVIPCVLLMLFMCRERFMRLAELMPECSVYKYTGYYCPGCGNTRSVRALMHGDILLALRNNPTLPFCGLIGLLGYAEFLIGFSGRNIKLVPRKLWFWILVAVLFAAYFVVRNFVPAIAPVPS